MNQGPVVLGLVAALLLAPTGGEAVAGQRPSAACTSAPARPDPNVPWAQQQLAPQSVWPVTRGAGVTVGVVDSGVDGSSPQLAGGRVLPGADVTKPGAGRADSDCEGHGTFVAGIIAAGTRDDAGFAGMAPDARILPIRVTTGPNGQLTDASLAAGIRRAVDGGATVINVSASADVPDRGLENAVAYAANHDVVLVASAANGAQRGDARTYPASYPGVLAVGAVDLSGRRADFSETGPWLGLVGPGVGVTSIGPRGPGHLQGNGTSYSAPFVTGTAALVRAAHPRLSAREVVHRLEATASHPPGPLPNPALGWGMVDPNAAVTALLPEERGSASSSRSVEARPGYAPAPTDTGLGALPAVLAVLGAVALIMLVVVGARLGGAGRRRGWKRARVVEVVPTADHDRARNRW